MKNHHEVISAFLDDEPFEPARLAEALSEPEGHAALIDLVALRHLMQPPPNVVAIPPRRRSPLRTVLAAAAVLVAMAGGFWLGERRGQLIDSAAPAATRVIETGDWQPLP